MCTLNARIYEISRGNVVSAIKTVVHDFEVGTQKKKKIYFMN